MTLPSLVISGFQDGGDIGGIKAAVAAGIPTGGWIPRGFKTESGPKPHYAALYGAKEHPSPEYPPRTKANAEWADRTIVFNLGKIPLLPGKTEAFHFTIDWRKASPGTQLVMRTMKQLGRSNEAYYVWRDGGLDPESIADFLRIDMRLKKGFVLNIAGGRESSSPGIEAFVFDYLSTVFRLLASAPGPA